MTSIHARAATKETTVLSHPKYRPDIDGLRALAVLSVVAFHAFPSLIKGGFVGVDVFFVISGFLISSIIFGSLERNTFSFTDFYSRRANRIFPALSAVLLACLFFGWFALFADEYMQLGKHVASGSAFISNFVLLNEAGYFDNSAETKVLLHLWSLGIEEQFYLIWPLMVWLAWKSRVNALAMIILVGAASFWLNIKGISSDKVSTFYSPQTRFWELLIGSGLAYWTLHKDKIAPAWRPTAGPAIRNLMSLAGLGMLVVAFSTVTKDNLFPGWWALLPTVGTAMVIAAGPSAWFNRIFLSSRGAVAIGLISFPLYLWHWPFLTFARIVESGVPSVGMRLTAVATAILLAWATYKWLEIPLRHGGRSFLKTGALTAMMVAIGLAGLAIYSKSGMPDRPTIKFSNAINEQFVGPLWKYTKNESCLRKYPLTESADYGWWFCMESQDAAPTVMLVGTSFANHLYAGFAQNDATRHQTILSIGTCDPALPDTAPPGTAVTTHPCSGDRPLHQKELINRIIDQARSVKYVVLDGLTQSPDEAYTRRLSDYIDQLQKKGVQVLVFIPHLMLGYDAKSCYSRPLKQSKNDCSIDYKQRAEIDAAYAKVKQEVSRLHPDVKYFDQNELLCRNGACTGIQDGMPLYRDEYGHYSEYGSVELSKLFVKWAKTNAPGILKTE